MSSVATTELKSCSFARTGAAYGTREFICVQKRLSMSKRQSRTRENMLVGEASLDTMVKIALWMIEVVSELLEGVRTGRSAAS